MCLHKLLFFTPPFLSGRGSGGWSEPLSRRSPKSRECSGTTFTPSLRAAAKQSGVGVGTPRRVAPSARRPPHSRLPRRFTPRKDGAVVVRSRTTVRSSGESRGVQPHWQEEWRMCLHKLLFFTSPFLPGRGPGGWSEPLSRRSPKSRECNGTTLTPSLRAAAKQSGVGVGTPRRVAPSARRPPHSRLPRRFTPRKDGAVVVRSRTTARSSGESRGVQPHWQEEWRMCLHKLLFFTSPFLSGRGSGGWCEPLSRQSSKPQQESRGRRPLAGVLGVPPKAYYYFPLPSRKGARGMVRAPIEAKLTGRGSPSGSRRVARPDGSLQ